MSNADQESWSRVKERLRAEVGDDVYSSWFARMELEAIEDSTVRLSVPTRHREVLGATAQGALTITKHPHGCLMVFPRPEWERFRERIAALPMSAQWWKRIFLGNAMDVEIDASGRVLVSPELRASAGITRDAVLLGMGNYFELWDKATYDAQEAQAMQQAMPDVFKDFSF